MQQVKNEEELISALLDENVDQVILANDITLYKSVTIIHDLSFDLNGHTLTYDGVIQSDKNGSAGLIDISEDANVTISGDGVITYNKAEDGGYMNSDSTGYCLRVNDQAQVRIESGTFDAGLTCVQAGDSSKVTIINGRYRADVTWNDRYWLLNLIDQSDAVIEVYGGTFEQYDPSASESENPVKNFLGEGASVQKDGTNYVVSHLHNQAITLPSKDATCDEDGWTEGKRCSICGVLTKEQEVIKASGHHYVNGVCTVCGAMDPGYVAAPTVDVTKPASSIALGINEDGDRQSIADQVQGIVQAVKNGEIDTVTQLSPDTVANIQKVFGETDDAVVTASVVVDHLEAEAIDDETAALFAQLIQDKNTSSQKQIAQYFDIRIVLKAYMPDHVEEVGQLITCDEPITFTLAIPSDLQKEGRVFYMARIHNGEMELLPVKESEDGQSFSFETDRFSIYALVYEDASTGSTNVTTPAEDTKNPETSAIAVGGMFACMAVLSAGIALVSWKKRSLSK